MHRKRCNESRVLFGPCSIGRPIARSVARHRDPITSGVQISLRRGVDNRSTIGRLPVHPFGRIGALVQLSGFDMFRVSAK